MSFPYKESVAKYRNQGWFGTLPLPKGQKESPPTDWTGKKAGYPDKELITVWISERKYKDGNICLRLAGVSEEYEVIGIDVDHYESGGKSKLGGDQLIQLESTLGPLPRTWISTARNDGVSGIRYFLVPRGLAFRGKAAKDIDIISKGYRYALVWPSIHPNGSIYLWYVPGQALDGNGTGNIPLAKDLPVLPDAWLDFLTANRTEFSLDELDLTLSADGMVDWAHDNFFEHNDMCYRMKQKLELHKQGIKADPSSHDKIVNAHYNITRLAAEGHYGWFSAIEEIEKYYAEDVIKRGKRGLSELQGELFRSRTNALRKVKLQVENDGGVPPNDPECCAVGLRDVDGYDTTHDGNGEHFRDLKQIDGESTIYYVADWKKWIVWQVDSQDEETGFWKVDEEDGGLIRRQWWDVKFRQQAFVEQLKADYEAEIAAAIAQGLPARGNGVNVPNSLIIARNRYEKWNAHTLKSGDNFHAEASIKNAAKRWLTISSMDLNPDRNVIACSNGVLEINLEEKRVDFRKQRLNDLITLNTGFEWNEKPQNPTVANMWNSFLDKFIPDASIQRMVQMAMGYTLMPGNPERVLLIALGPTSTGKSTFVNLCGKSLGDYAAVIGKTMFQSYKFKPSLILNARKNMLYTTESDGNTSMSLAVTKEYSGGSDRIEVERKGVDDVIVLDLNFVTVLATNQMLTFSELDLAIKRRLYILPFDEMVSRDEEDKTFSSVFEKVGLEYVFRWLVQGLIMYMENGEHGALIHNRFTDQLVDEALVETGDPIIAFMDECLELHEHHSNFHIDKGVWTGSRPEWCVSGAMMYQHFKAWFYDNEYQQRDLPTPNALTRKLKALGMRKPKEMLWVNGKDGRYWLGVKMKPGARIFAMPVMPLNRRTGQN